jgi:hypothetical protein
MHATTALQALISSANKVIEYLNDVRYWPKADITSCTAHVRYWG